MSPTKSPRRNSVRVAVLLLMTVLASAMSGCAMPRHHLASCSQVAPATPTQVVQTPTQVAPAPTQVEVAAATRVEFSASYQPLTGATLALRRSQVVADRSEVVADRSQVAVGAPTQVALDRSQVVLAGASAAAPRLGKAARLVMSPASHDGSTLPADAPAVSLAGASQVDVAAACPPAGTRVLLIGDSLSHGLGPVMARLAKRCGTPFFHKGVIGSHVTQWAQDHWLVPELNRAQPTVVMVSLGGNDFQRTDPDNVRRAIPRFLDKVNARGARLLWISPPTFPFSDKIDVRGMWRDALASRSGVATFHAERLSIPRGPDKIHPDMPGNRALSKTLWQWLASETPAS